MKKYQCLIFDWDGTLMDSAQKISESIRAAATDCGLPVPTDQQARSIIGLGLQECMLKLFGDIDQVEIDRMVVRFRYYFLEANKTPQPLFEGVREGLQSLQASGVALCVATGKNRVGLNRVFEKESMHDFFFYTRTADEARSKPHPQMLLDILDYIGIDASDALMIGDTTYDMDMAKGANVDAIGVDYGVHSESELKKSGALAVFSRYSDLQTWLEPRAIKLFGEEPFKMSNELDENDNNLIGDPSTIEEGAKGLLFSVKEITPNGDELEVPAFAIRYDNQVRAFKNRCGHIAVTLDFQPGEFFTEEGDALVCATHGATYAPDTGKCLGGPCFGVGLEPLKVVILDNRLYLDDESVTLIKN